MSAQTRAGRSADASVQPASTTSQRYELLFPALRLAEAERNESRIRETWDGIADAATEPHRSN